MADVLQRYKSHATKIVISINVATNERPYTPSLQANKKHLD